MTQQEEKDKMHLIFSIICIISLVTFIIPAHAAAGDLILDTDIYLHYPHFCNAENFSESSTLLKEGYSISLDGMRWIKASKGKEICVTNYSIVKNGDVVKRIRVIGNDHFCYNKTIDGKEYTIIEASVDSIFVGIGTDIVKLEPFRQYSDGSVIVEPDFITASLNPCTNETPPEEWNRTFGGVYDDFGRYGQSVQQTHDGGYIIVGSIRSYTPGMGSMYYYGLLIKIDINGNEQWNRTFEDIGLKNAYSVQQTSDGGYILTSAVDSYPNWRRETNPVLVKTDFNGSIEWHKTIGARGNDYVMSARQTHDGGYILAGSNSAWLIKTDENGSEQWNETFAVPKPYNACSVWQTPDGSYILTSGTDLYGAGSTDAWVIKTDVNGKQEWNRTFGSDFFDTVYSIEQTLDGGYLLAGSVNSNDTGYCACLVKTDANGSEQWNRTIGPGLMARISSIWQTLDGGYVLAGNIDKAKNPEFRGKILFDNDDVWLFKTDASGNLEWSKTFGGLKNDEAGFVRQISDSGYIIAGITESYGAGGSDLWLVKTDKEGKEQWNNTFGRDRNDWIESIQQTHDGGYILAGVTLSFWLGVNHSEFLMVKTDSNGNEQWYRTFGGVGAEFNPSVGLSPNGGYILGGGTLSFDDANYWLIKTDEDGNMQWDQTFEGYGLHSFLQTTDDGYIINGNLYNPSIIKIDLNGTEQWDIRMKCNGLNSVLQTSDGGYILAGIYNSKPLLVKLMAEVSVLTAKFTFEPGNPVANESITFDASASHDPYGNITYYQWDLGGGSYVNTTQRIVTHSYDEGGNYSVGLTVTDDEGEMDSINREITVQQLAPLDERWDQTFGGAGDDRVHSLENTSEEGDALTDGEPVLTPDVPGFGAVVAALGLLVCVGLVGRHRR